MSLMLPVNLIMMIFNFMVDIAVHIEVVMVTGDKDN